VSLRRIALGLSLGLGLLAGLSGPLLAASGLTTEQRIELLERRVAKVTDLTLALDAVREENSRLRGQIETLQHQIEQLKRKQRDIYLDIDQRISSLQASGVPQPAAAPASAPPSAAPAAVQQAGAPPAATAQEQPAAPADPQQMQADYKAAYALLSPQARRYEDAAKAFKDFLDKYPNAPLSANAQYWLGEAYYVSQKNDEALEAFDKLVSGYPDSAKVPGALYKIGRIQASRGDKAAAIATLKKVVDGYPTAPAAGLAREQLNRLQQGR
jgi:tol-pal system protein YbgF